MPGIHPWLGGAANNFSDQKAIMEGEAAAFDSMLDIGGTMVTFNTSPPLSARIGMDDPTNTSASRQYIQMAIEEPIRTSDVFRCSRKLLAKLNPKGGNTFTFGNTPYSISRIVPNMQADVILFLYLVCDRVERNT